MMRFISLAILKTKYRWYLLLTFTFTEDLSIDESEVVDDVGYSLRRGNCKLYKFIKKYIYQFLNDILKQSLTFALILCMIIELRIDDKLHCFARKHLIQGSVTPFVSLL
jgi:hypothetical protein